MTTNLTQVSHSRSTSQQFLISKTDAKPSVVTPLRKLSPNKDALLAAFPELQFGQSLVDTAMETLNSAHKFGALAIKIDAFALDKPGMDQNGILMSVAESIHAVIQHEDGIWGQLEPEIFVCFLSDKTAPTCFKIGKDIQENLSDLRSETVTIGVAAYPAVNYQKPNILDNAKKALDHAAFFGPDSIVSFDSVSLNISGDKRYADGDVHGGIEEFKRALLLDPSNINVHNSLGVCYGVLGKLNQAKEEFETANWLNPDEYMAIYNTGVINLLLEKKNDALESFQKAHRLSEDVFEISLETGRLCVELKDYKNGQKYLEEAVRLNSSSSSAYRSLGECYEALDMIDPSTRAYRSAIKLNPNDSAALSSLGCLFDLKGENSEISTTFCRQSVEISPDNGLYRHRLGHLYLKQNRYEAALVEFEEAHRLGYDSDRQIKKTQSIIDADAS